MEITVKCFSQEIYHNPGGLQFFHKKGEVLFCTRSIMGQILGCTRLKLVGYQWRRSYVGVELQQLSIVKNEDFFGECFPARKCVTIFRKFGISCASLSVPNLSPWIICNKLINF